MDLNALPRLVCAHKDGHIFEHESLYLAVDDGFQVRLPRPEELLPLPFGSDLFFLPDRAPMGFDPEKGQFVVVEGVFQTSAFICPRFLRLAHPAYKTLEGALVLPLFAYAPLGSLNGRFYTLGKKVDRSRRQDPRLFDIEKIKKACTLVKKVLRNNRLVEHLENCALTYFCRAAQNFFLGREECPLPTSPVCNAQCVGCLSRQPQGGPSKAQERIKFVPDPIEIAEVAVFHIGRVKSAVVSFGQGCEGEPLMVGDCLKEAITLIRKKTDKGTINLNTNGSLPDVVSRLCDAGLDSIRLTINSFRVPVFEAYTKPKNFGLEDVLESGIVTRRKGGFVSVNLLVFPGVTDTMADIEATIAGLQMMRADMVQLRNLNIDPELYLRSLPQDALEKPIGILNMLTLIKERLPAIRFGYFNPPVRSLVARRRAKIESD